MHRDEHDSLKDREALRGTSDKNTASVADKKKKGKIGNAFLASRPYAADDPKAAKITKLIMEMLALDDLPFHFVNGKGFQRLMKFVDSCYQMPDEKYFRMSMLPDAYSAIHKRVSDVITTYEHVNLMTDIWSTPQCSNVLISFTAH